MTTTDCLYISRVVHDPNHDARPKKRYKGIYSGLNKLICTGIQQRIAIEKQPYGFSVDISSPLPYYYKECTLEEVIDMLDNIDDYIENPEKYGFEINGP
ncbi:hypothetical protein [Psychrobacter sp. I-STPA6b]|uniref:hypothetical protein n=1 Tax=Psychrobacter sp. I-STPA6b TaxID=2585718 RepID=UPI001D0C648E|nr:hypothetical protein [Psychrobacter sp. I-STPA6b]